MRKKLFCILLTVSMILSLLPMQAFAGGTSWSTEYSEAGFGSANDRISFSVWGDASTIEDNVGNPPDETLKAIFEDLLKEYQITLHFDQEIIQVVEGLKGSGSGSTLYTILVPAGTTVSLSQKFDKVYERQIKKTTHPGGERNEVEVDITDTATITADMTNFGLEYSFYTWINDDAGTLHAYIGDIKIMAADEKSVIPNLVFSPAAGEVEMNTPITITSEIEGVKIEFGYMDEKGDILNVSEYSENNKPIITQDVRIVAFATKDGYEELFTGASYTVKGGSAPTPTPPAETQKTKITISNRGNGDSGILEYPAGDIIEVYAGTRSGYRFIGWTSSLDSLVLEDEHGTYDLSQNILRFEVPSEDFTLTANWKKKSSSKKSTASKNNTETTKKNEDAAQTEEDKSTETSKSYTEKECIILTIDETKASVFGQMVENDVTPTLRNGRTSLPIRLIAEALGIDVSWDEENRKVTLTKNNKTINIYIDAPHAFINETAVELDSPAFIENDRTYLPLRFISEHFDAEVLWNGTARSVTIIPKK